MCFLMQTVTAASMIPMEVDKVLSCMQPVNTEVKFPDYTADTATPGQFSLIVCSQCSPRLLCVL